MTYGPAEYVLARIEAVWAFVAIDEDGSEGVMAFYDPSQGGWMPLVCADQKRVDSLRPMAAKISAKSGLPYKLVRFSQREEIPL